MMRISLFRPIQLMKWYSNRCNLTAASKAAVSSAKLAEKAGNSLSKTKKVGIENATSKKSDIKSATPIKQTKEPKPTVKVSRQKARKNRIKARKQRAQKPTIQPEIQILEKIPSPFTIASHPFDLKNGSKPLDIQKSTYFAVLQIQGRQYKVTKDDVFVTHKTKGTDIGQELNITDVLLIGSEKTTVIGRPKVDGVTVKVAIEEKTKDKKVHILKFRRRKNSKRLRGFRRDVTVFRVLDIIPPQDLIEHL